MCYVKLTRFFTQNYRSITIGNYLVKRETRGLEIGHRVKLLGVMKNVDIRIEHVETSLKPFLGLQSKVIFVF